MCAVAGNVWHSTLVGQREARMFACVQGQTMFATAHLLSSVKLAALVCKCAALRMHSTWYCGNGGGVDALRRGSSAIRRLSAKKRRCTVLSLHVVVKMQQNHRQSMHSDKEPGGESDDPDDGGENLPRCGYVSHNVVHKCIKCRSDVA